MAYKKSLTPAPLAPGLLSLVIISVLTPAKSVANNVSLSYNQFKQSISRSAETVVLTPAGVGVQMSFDISPSWSVDFDYQAWQGDHSAENSALIDLKLKTWGGSVSYYQDNWFASSSISVSDDELLFTSAQRATNYRLEDTTTISFAAIAGYNWHYGQWLYDAAIGVQYTDWGISVTRSHETADVVATKLNELTANLNTNISIAHFWPMRENYGVLLGAALSWSLLLGDENGLIASQGSRSSVRRQSNNNDSRRANSSSRRISTGDNEGQISLFAVFEINGAWSIDIDTTASLSNSEHNNNWTVGLVYSF